MIVRRRPDERGAVGVMTALLMLVLLAATALAVDAGNIYAERRELQRTADVSAISGVQTYLEGLSEAEATAIEYIEKNPTRYHPAKYEPVNGDLVVARSAASGGCIVDGIGYDCVESTVTVPEFEYYFGPALGIHDARVSATAKAVIGNAAVGGDKLVPWVLVDCPDAYGEGRGFADEQSSAVADAVAAVNPSCPYVFSDNFNSGQVSLFLADASGGNFQGADLSAEPDCPSTPSGLFPKSGGAGANDYRDFLEGDPTDDVLACNIGPGARLYSKSGNMVGPTNQALDDRDIDACMDATSFATALDGEGDGDGVVTIVNYNPCILALVLVVHTDETHPSVTSDVPGNVAAMQHPDALDIDADEEWRFASLTRGTSLPMIVRRLAFFYITSRGNNSQPYQGLFLRALDADDSVLSGPLDPAAGIYKVQLTD